jgi:hypothetical protein
MQQPYTTSRHAVLYITGSAYSWGWIIVTTIFVLRSNENTDAFHFHIGLSRNSKKALAHLKWKKLHTLEHSDQTYICAMDSEWSTFKSFGHCNSRHSTFSILYANVCCDKPGKRVEFVLKWQFSITWYLYDAAIQMYLFLHGFRAMLFLVSADVVIIVEVDSTDELNNPGHQWLAFRTTLLYQLYKTRTVSLLRFYFRFCAGRHVVSGIGSRRN